MFSDDYDTSEKCRAPAWTDRILWKRRKQLPDINNAPDHSSSGRLLYYGRAELKQSDHRPVIAIIDVECHRVDEEKRSQVFYDVIRDMGPPDATIIVHCENAPDTDESVFNDSIVMTLLEDFAQFGETILVRFVAETMWITFRESQSVLEAMKKTNGQLIVKRDRKVRNK